MKLFKQTMLLSSLILSSSLTLAAPPGNANGLDTIKPSQRLTLSYSGYTPCNKSYYYALDTVINRDGTTSPFSIPAGQVFVISQIEQRNNTLIIESNAGSANLLGPNAPNGPYTDLVVASGVRICTYSFASDPVKDVQIYRVRGHLANDN